jgi:hypothetical protein
MKKIRIANGIKRLDDSDGNTVLFRLRDILSEHRSILINRLLSDLVTYIDYKFSIRATARQVDSVKDSLVALKNSVLDLDRYSDILDHFHQSEMTYVGNEKFMQEIDEHITAALNLPQLKLV